MDRVRVKDSVWVGFLKTLGLKIAEEAFEKEGAIIEIVDSSGEKISEYIIEKKQQ